tara:strand:+ start:341 stop:3307 length:2967 start_codon:yes stop_codon:yes gene_type:complete
MFNKQTTLDLDGPKLGFSTDPQDLTVNTGTAATFVAIGTAIFPSNIPAQFATNTGIVTYRWYVDDVAVFDDPDKVGAGESAVGVNYLGAGTTTLQIFDSTKSKTVYCEADYIPSAYGLPGVAVTVGSARSTGHAISEPIRSASATLSIIPTLSIDTQPVDRIVVVGTAATFGVDASLSNESTEGFSYQWQVNGSDVSDGTLVVGTTKNNTATLTYTRNNANNLDAPDSDTAVEVDFSELSTITLTYGIYDITVDADVTADLRALGAGGGSSIQRSIAGGSGGLSTGQFTFLEGTTYKLVVGGAGEDGGQGGAGLDVSTDDRGISSGNIGGGGQGGGGSGRTGGGGGFTGLFVGSVSQDNAVIIAGGGGGGSNDPALGGDGGGLTGGDGANAPRRGGQGGTQSAGGDGGTASGITWPGEDGFAIGTLPNDVQASGGRATATDPTSAGGGGGGYFGGGGAASWVGGCCADGAGGGGSGYIGSSLLTDGETTTGGGADPGTSGSFEITLTDTDTTTDATLTISGATTDVLSISSDNPVSATAKVVVSNSNASNSPVTSQAKTFTSLVARAILNIEQYDFSDTATISSHNFTEDGDLILTDEDYPANEICVYAPERDIEVEMELFGGKGITQRGQGGQGGYSKITFTMERNVEYIITGLYDGDGDNQNRVFTPFVYRKANLIAVVGSGGAGANVNNDGGEGGGISQAGGDGQGSDDSGRGGRVIQPGELPTNGVHGSMSPQDPVGDDTKITELPDYGGRTIPCSRGIYYRNEGFSACEDVGNVRYRISDGTEVSNSAIIERGFKAGYNIMMTNGGEIGGVNGGRGATGGEAGDNGNGGGGGSGYTDGSVTVLEATQGGSARDAATVIIRLYVPPLVGNMTNHTFDNTLDRTNRLDYDGAISFMTAESPGAADRQTGTSVNLKHYLLTMNQNYSSLSISNISSNTSGGGGGVDRTGPAKVEKVSGSDTQWRVWFKKQNGFNTYVRSFSVEGVI